MDEEKMRETYYKYLSDLSEIDEAKAEYRNKKNDIDTEWDTSKSIYKEEMEMISDFAKKYGESEELLLMRRDMGVFYEQEEADFKKQESILEEEYKALIEREKNIEEEYRKWIISEETEDKNG